MKNYSEALQCYNDALEIDDNNKESLASRAAVYIEMNNFMLSQQDAEQLLSISPQHPQVCISICWSVLKIQKSDIYCYKCILSFILNILRYTILCSVSMATKCSY